MEYIAKENFAGKVSMCIGERATIPDDIAKDLLRCGYIEKAGGKEPTEETETAKAKKGKKA